MWRQSLQIPQELHESTGSALIDDTKRKTPMNDGEIKTLLDARISRARAKELLIALVKVPSPQTERLEDEPLLKAFITSAIEPRLRSMAFVDLRYDAMGNLIATYGAGTSNKSLMFIGNGMNQPASTMPNPYDGDVVDGAAYGLPGECVMGKGASEQKANLAAMLHAMETVIASKVAIKGKLVFTCCLSGETGKHDAIKSVVEGAGVRADMAVLGGTGLKVTLGNRGRIDVFVTVKGAPCHSSRPWDGVNAVTGATEAIRLLLAKVKVDKSHPQLGRQSLTVNHIRSFPDSTHTVQERCELTLDRRLLPGDDPNEAFAEIERIAKEVERIEDPVSGKTYGVEVRLGPFMSSVAGDDGFTHRQSDPARERGHVGQTGRDLLLPLRLRPGLPQPRRHRDGKFRRRRTPIRPHRLRHGLGRAHRRCGQGLRLHDAGLSDVALLIPASHKWANVGPAPNPRSWVRRPARNSGAEDRGGGGNSSPRRRFCPSRTAYRDRAFRCAGRRRSRHKSKA